MSEQIQKNADMFLTFKTTYEWSGTDYIVHLTDQYNYFSLRLVFQFEYDDSGKLFRRIYTGYGEFSEAMKAIADLNHRVLQKKGFWTWAEVTTIVESLPGWMRGMIDMPRVKAEVDKIPSMLS